MNIYISTRMIMNYYNSINKVYTHELYNYYFRLYIRVFIEKFKEREEDMCCQEIDEFVLDRSSGFKEDGGRQF